MLGPGPLVVPQKTPGESDGRGIQLYIISIITIILAGITWFFLAQIFYKIVVTLNKVSLLLFYLRIFPSKSFQFLTWIGLAIVGATGITFIAGTIWQCHPLPYFWDWRIKGGDCIRSAPWWQSYSAIQIATDVFILVLLIPSLASLSLKLRHKLALIGVSALGGFVCIATIVRPTTLASSAGKDPTYNPIPATNWKFGKQIQKRQLEMPEYAVSFVNYKALKKLMKKLIKKLSATHLG
ncbi:hypothetical protein VE03_00115 [Pseudogymnoascus sp. 23342-1-I1]|nr:hypothetical protein VE03_00115 [Pseudogymnoascus sp. 23342-1-I1]